MLHYEQVFGNEFERRESKCRTVLMKHCRKVKGEQVIILQMDQQLKTKNISEVPGQHFCKHRQTDKIQIHYIDDQDKFQSVKDTDNEFTECQTPRKKLQSVGISPSSVSFHEFTKTLKSNISEA